MTYLIKLLGFFYKKSIILKKSKELQHGDTVKDFIWVVATFYLLTTTPKLMWIVILPVINYAL